LEHSNQPIPLRARGVIQLSHASANLRSCLQTEMARHVGLR
jgi:hypothetical protein